jgi:hypothetical protein
MGQGCLERTRYLHSECFVVVNPTCVGTLRNTCVSLRGLLFSSYIIETCVYSELYVDTASAAKGLRGHQAVTQKRWWWYEEEKGCRKISLGLFPLRSKSVITELVQVLVADLVVLLIGSGIWLSLAA